MDIFRTHALYKKKCPKWYKQDKRFEVEVLAGPLHFGFAPSSKFGIYIKHFPKTKYY